MSEPQPMWVSGKEGPRPASVADEWNQGDDSHPLDWYPGDGPESRSEDEVAQFIAENDPETLRAIATRLEHGQWHPSKELATSLVRAASHALLLADGQPAQVTDIRKGLLAAERLFKLRGARLIESNLLVAQRIRTEWELGQMLQGTSRHPGGRPSENPSSGVTGFQSLRDLGVTRNQSSMFQRVASLDLEDLDDWIGGVVNDPHVELSTTMVLDVLWRERTRERKTAERVRVAESVLPADVVLEVADATSVPLAEGVVDLTFTSPPYALEIEYHGGDVEAGDWTRFMRDWMRDAYRVTKPSGRLAVNVPLDTSKPYPRATYAETVLAALQVGWEYRFTIVWDEGNTSKGNRSLGSVNSSAKPYHVSPAEMIAVFSKGAWGPSFEGKDDILPDDWQAWGREVWRMPGESNAFEDHPAPFPEALAKRVIQYLTPIGATVMDPFLGSGTVALVASRLGRRVHGYDISEAYVESAQRRVAQ